MNKEHFLQAGFEVHEGQHSLVVTTPQTFVSGDPACFWVRSARNKVILNDYGHTLNALELSIPNPVKAIEIIKSTLARLDSQVHLDGVALIREIDEAHIDMAIGDYINLFAILTTYRPRTISEQNLDEIMAVIHHSLAITSYP